MSRLFDDANNEYLEIGSIIVDEFPLTLAAWIYSNDATTCQSVISISASIAADFFRLSLRGDIEGDPVRFECKNGGYDSATSTAGYSVNTWHHVCGIETNATSRAVFLDGGNKGVNANAGVPAGLDTTSIGRLLLGAGDTNERISGRIAEAAIWNVALTDDEVTAQAGGVSPTRIRPESLVAYWPLYGVGSPEPDYRGTYNLTLVNGPIQADHAPVQPPFGFDIGWIRPTAVPAVARIPRPPAAYNTLAVY